MPLPPLDFTVLKARIEQETTRLFSATPAEFASLPEFDNDALSCPRCGGTYLHQRMISIFERGEDDPITLVVQVDDYTVTNGLVESKRTKNPSSRRQGLAISFRCEVCGPDVAELTIAQHKGQTFIEWREICKS